MWIWRDGAFVPIVDAAIFEQAGRIIESRHQHLTDQDLLERLRELLRKHGRLSGLLIDETETMPSSSCYSTRFGSLVRAYTLIGWDPDRDFSYVEINRSIRRRHADLISAIFDELLALGATVSDGISRASYPSVMLSQVGLPALSYPTQLRAIYRCGPTPSIAAFASLS
jgi:hypothetical protein